jgi:two-component system, NarL family, sensor kinase
MNPAPDDLVLLIVYTAIAFLLMATVLVLFFYFSKKKIIQKELEKRDLEISHQRQLLHQIIITQEEERERIAQDLHDDISSKLNIVSLNSHLLTTPGLSDDELAKIRDTIIDLTGKSLENARRIAHDLMPPVLQKFGLEAGLRELCAEFDTTQQVKVAFSYDLDNDSLPDMTGQLQVFRIMQELMNNSLRHGKADRITVELSQQDGSIGIGTPRGKRHRYAQHPQPCRNPARPIRLPEFPRLRRIDYFHVSVTYTNG